MIARYSESYPYLAIAQHLNVPYGRVLALADLLDHKGVVVCVEQANGDAALFDAILRAHAHERVRRISASLLP